MKEKPYLVWCSTPTLLPKLPALFAPDRNFDVVIHTYDANPAKLEDGALYEWANISGHNCWTIHQPGEKLNVAGRVMRSHLRGYRQFAFLDDDLSFTTDELNRAFAVGDTMGLPLYQPALTLGSHCSHEFLLQKYPNINCVRHVPFVEIMCPFFSRLALEDCLPTFDINESGWGLDCYLWPKAVNHDTYVLDSIAFGHYRAPGRRDRILRNGLTCWQELWIQQVINDPATAPVNPPGYKRPVTADALA